MPKIRKRFPTIFVGYPYSIPEAQFRGVFRELPFDARYANTDLETKQILSKIKGMLRKVDFAIFDVSTWNPNVTLELGLAEGMGIPYYITLNKTRAADVPSDIKGLQRIEYSAYKYNKKGSGLGDQLIQYVLSKEHWAKELKTRLASQKNEKKMLPVGLKAIGYLREKGVLSREHAKKIASGTHLRDADIDGLLDAMHGIGLLVRPYGKSTGYRLKAGIFKRS